MNKQRGRIEGESELGFRANLASGSRGTRHDSFAGTRMEERNNSQLTKEKKKARERDRERVVKMCIK